MGVSADAKQLNTHLHLMEAMIPYVLGSQDPVARDRLIELIFIQSNAVVRKTVGACTDLHGRDWKPLAKSEQAQVTFGHDLENVWLLIEASNAAGVSNGPLTDLYRALFNYSVQHGFDRERGGFHYSGFLNQPAHQKAKIWWVQAEALVSALHMHFLTGEASYFDFFAKTLDWISHHQADWKHGDWYFEIAEDGTASGDKAGNRHGAWKTPYHNGRAVLLCLDMIERNREALVRSLDSSID
jgi:mannobiose 2-epimerase